MGAVCGGGGEEESIVCSSDFCDHSVLYSIQIISSAFIGVDMAVTGIVVGVSEGFRIGNGGGGNFGFSSGGFCGFGTWILKDSLLVS